MISAFGIEHGYDELAKTGPDATASPHRPGPASGTTPRVRPSPEEIARRRAAGQAHRQRATAAQQAKQRAAGPGPAAARVPAPSVPRVQQARYSTRVPYRAPPISEHFAGRVPATAALTAAVAGGALYLLHRDRAGHSGAVRKAAGRDPARDRREQALGALAGGAAGHTLDSVGGAATKAGLKIHRARVGRSPADSAIWRAHRARFGVEPGMASTGKQQLAMHRAYPKSLPAWRMQRALAIESRPAVVGALVAGGALAGGGLVHRRQQRS